MRHDFRGEQARTATTACAAHNETGSIGENHHPTCAGTAPVSCAHGHAEDAIGGRVVLLPFRTSGNVHLSAVRKGNLLLLHKTVRTAGDLPAVLLGNWAPRRDARTGSGTSSLGEAAFLFQPFRRVLQIFY